MLNIIGDQLVDKGALPAGAVSKCSLIGVIEDIVHQTAVLLGKNLRNQFLLILIIYIERPFCDICTPDNLIDRGCLHTLLMKQCDSSILNA